MAGKLINTLVHAIHFSFVAITFSLLLVSYLKISSTEYQYINGIGNNWNLGLLASINVSNGACDIASDNILKDSWGGTMAGCDCSRSYGVSFYGNPLTRGTCSSKTSRKSNSYSNSLKSYGINVSGCYDVPATPPVRYRNWGGKTVCAKRIQKSYLDLIVERKPENCPAGHRNCGIVDSFNNVLCVPTNTPCPINKLIFLNENEILPKDFNYTVINLEQGKSIAYTNQNIGGELVSQFKVSEGQPCMNPKQTNINSQKYLLDNAYYNSGCPEVGEKAQMYDDNYKKLDSDEIFDFYLNNGVEAILKSLPQYTPTSKTDFIDLYSRDYFGLDSLCKQRILNDKEGAKGLIQTLVFFEENVGSILFWTLLSFIIACIAFFVEIILPCCSCSSENELKKLPFCGLIFYFIFSGSLIITCSVGYSKINSLPKNYQLLSGNCLDESTNIIINSFSSNFTVGISMILYSLIVVSCTFLFNFVYIIIGVVDKGE